MIIGRAVQIFLLSRLPLQKHYNSFYNLFIEETKLYGVRHHFRYIPMSSKIHMQKNVSQLKNDLGDVLGHQ